MGCQTKVKECHKMSSLLFCFMPTDLYNHFQISELL
jgi:hypothetical protein